MFSAILSHIRKHVSLSHTEEESIISALDLRQVKKKEHLLSAGEVCHRNFFIINGCFRMYLITNKGVEQVIQFGIENWWITDYTSFKSVLPSGFYIQATENSEVASISRSALEELYHKVPQLERYFRLVAEKAYAAQLMRIHYIFNLTGEEQYRMMAARYPEFVQRIPQYMLASFLGITPEFLSALRAKKE